jgi:23S rRNA (guanine745-N1)-methyltransferase
MIADDLPAGAVRPPRWRCPHCALPLTESEKVVACANGHVFDRAREGYVNLLVGGRLAGGPSGDDEAMVRARRTVFDAGMYEPVIDAVASVVAGSGARSVLDAGCGEGTYLARAASAARADGWGIDISKAACRLAARRHSGLHIAVASSYQLPFADESFEALINVFSPRSFSEMMRVLAPGGVAVVATPGAGHLAQLKALIYDAPRAHREPDEAPEPDRPPAESIGRVAFTLDLADPQLRRSLLEMTPYWWNTSPERRAVIEATPLLVDVDVVLTVYRRTSTVSSPSARR